MFSTRLFIIGALFSFGLVDPSNIQVTEGIDEEPVIYRYRRIIRGQNAASIDFPFAASIQARLHSGIHSFLFGGVDHFCGGTLVSPKWIVTAAHCLYATAENGELISLLDPKLWHIRLATNKLKPSALDRIKGFFNRAYNTLFGYSKIQNFYHIKKIILHPQYKAGFLENDIALLMLKEPVLIHRISNLEILPLPKYVNENLWPHVGQKCTAIGWGCTCATCPPEMMLQQTDMPILSATACKAMYRGPINLTDTKEFCAGYFKMNQGICPGDSGGPLVCEFEGKRRLAGIVSATHAKQPEMFPAVFTRVSYYTDWIESIIDS